MAYTFLQLVQRLARKVGVPGTGPITCQNQTGEAGRLVSWVSEAWLDIQEQHQDWNFMRTSLEFPTVAGQAIYTPAQIGVNTTLSIWKRDTFRTYVTTIGYASEVFLQQMLYDNWRDLYQFGSLRFTQTRPVIVSIAPNKSVCLGPSPDANGYTVVCDYFTKPTEFANDVDLPTLPDHFQLLIVYRAMMSYGGYESAPEVYQEGQTEFNRMMRRLEIDQQPQMTVADPMC